MIDEPIEDDDVARLRKFYATLPIDLLKVRLAQLAREKADKDRHWSIATEALEARLAELDAIAGERESER